jgi:probable rRNA maturation factor
MRDAESRMAPPDVDLSKVRSVDIDILIEAGDWPSESDLEAMARRTIAAVFTEAGIGAGTTEFSLVFTNDVRIRALNAGWRDKDKPTNVLSFPAFQPKRGASLPPMLGDVILARETISREAALEEKPFEHHLTHLIVHGLLHLLGYDHETETEAEEMEMVERRALARLAIPDPYA